MQVSAHVRRAYLELTRRRRGSYLRAQRAVNVLYILKLVGLGLNTLVLAPVVIAAAALDGRRAYDVCQLWVRLNLLAFGMRVDARRLVALDPGTPYVFMSNHRSQLDPLAVVSALPEFQLRWVAKQELVRIPLFGWALRRAGNIIIDRSNHMQAITRLRAACADMVKRGISVIIFPEGTRASGAETLLPFKKGGFMLALEAGFPIVPIVVRGSGTLLPKRDWRVRGGTVAVVVGPPIATVGADREELVRRVQAFMLDCIHGGTEPAGVREAV